MRIIIGKELKNISRKAYVGARRLSPDLRKGIPAGVKVNIVPQKGDLVRISAQTQYKPQGFVGFFQRAVTATGEQLANIGDLTNLQIMQEKIAVATQLAQQNLSNLIKK